jgi:hypothetical protein
MLPGGSAMPTKAPLRLPRGGGAVKKASGLIVVDETPESSSMLPGKAAQPVKCHIQRIAADGDRE